MIISRTPFRISFVGGGTDFAGFYQREPGTVLSTAINKYVYITVSRRFDSTLRVSYSKTEIVPTIEEIHHPLFRETMRLCGVDSGVEVTSIADIPAGTGLGSSSSFTVGLLHALQAYRGQYCTAGELAETACRVEIDILKEPIGRQDQYAAAFGGFRRYQFNSDGSVFVDPLVCPADALQQFFSHLALFYLGGSRDARSVLTEQQDKTAENMDVLRKLRELAERFWCVLVRGHDVRECGELLDHGWTLKKRLAKNVSNPMVDDYYQRARMAGALGGKLLGAGSGGFLLLFCEPLKKNAVRAALHGVRECDFGFEGEGSKIIYLGN